MKKMLYFQLEIILNHYILEHQKSPWWSHVIRAPFKALEWAMSLVRPDEDAAAASPANAYSKKEKEQSSWITQKNLCGYIMNGRASWK